jgi:hypothetical protein
VTEVQRDAREASASHPGNERLQRAPHVLDVLVTDRHGLTLSSLVVVYPMLED